LIASSGNVSKGSKEKIRNALLAMLAFSADHLKRRAALPARQAFSPACLANQHVETVVRNPWVCPYFCVMTMPIADDIGDVYQELPAQTKCTPCPLGTQRYIGVQNGANRTACQCKPGIMNPEISLCVHITIQVAFARRDVAVGQALR
jgi:hypothetical protein